MIFSHDFVIIIKYRIGGSIMLCPDSKAANFFWAGDSIMNSLLIAIAAPWEKCLREFLIRRGHALSVINDFREIVPAFNKADYSLAFVGASGSNDSTIEICRQLRACAAAKPLEILSCGPPQQSDKIQALLSAGIGDFLTDPENNAELEFRLALAEFRASRNSNPAAAIQAPGMGQDNNEIYLNDAHKDFFRDGSYYEQSAPTESDSQFRAIFESADRKLAEDCLRKSEALLRGLFENLPDFVILVDNEAKILYTNRDAPGATKEAMVGMYGFGFIRDSHQQQCREAFDKARSTCAVQEVECIDVFDHLWSCRVVPFVEHIAGGQAIVICTDITEKKQAAEAINMEQQLLRRIIDIHERDRQVTAYEIHDGISQQVTASLFHLEAFRRLWELDANAAEKSLETALKLISQSVNETRRLISGLRPLILDECGIVEAVNYLVCENKERSGMQIDFQHDVHFQRLAPPLESAAFRIVQEAVANACHHSRSPVVVVELIQRDDRLHIKVRDQGVGFDPNTVEETQFGLRSIRERARLLGGRAEIQSAPGSGTLISVELPVVLRADDET
jgi:PAS domain S-box-containing protein